MEIFPNGNNCKREKTKIEYSQIHPVEQKVVNMIPGSKS